MSTARVPFVTDVAHPLIGAVSRLISTSVHVKQARRRQSADAARSKTHSEASSGRLRLERTKLNLVTELSEFAKKFSGPPLECLRIKPSTVFDVAHALV